MTIDEAIKKLDYRSRIGDPLKCKDYEDALKLGIEALKRIKLWRQDNTYPDYGLLSGETEE